MVDGCTLRIAARYDDTVGAAAVHIIQCSLHQELANSVGATRKSIGGEQGSIVNTLGPDIGLAEDPLEAIGSGRANDSALEASDLCE